MGRKTKAAILSAAAAGFVWQGIEAHKQGREKDRQRLTVWASLLWLYAIVDAYVGAHLSRFDEEMKHASEEGRMPEGMPEQGEERHKAPQSRQD